MISQLERLGTLKAQGLLTEEDAAQKAKLLGKLTFNPFPGLRKSPVWTEAFPTTPKHARLHARRLPKSNLLKAVRGYT